MYYVQTYIHLIAALKFFSLLLALLGHRSLVAVWGLLTVVEHGL